MPVLQRAMQALVSALHRLMYVSKFRAETLVLAEERHSSPCREHDLASAARGSIAAAIMMAVARAADVNRRDPAAVNQLVTDLTREPSA
ncbi:hypothetical protein HL667_16230 [Bradyrhizobium sp. 83012]|uniref:TetR family transcriptional regulator n=2 Tax=Bradyrhizobium aeschynomenes TaxID=2734909 RepID=A0ABX2CFA3_9BRAD|nr:hypothetical protein [Bradyrhizobium aeschynomenes]